MSIEVVKMSDLKDGDKGDFFAMLSDKVELKTRDGKPYYKVEFRDALRKVSFPIWSDSTFDARCRDDWQVGEFFKLRATYKESTYGPQLDIHQIRLVSEQDDFDPASCVASSKFDSEEMYEELLTLAETYITDEELLKLVQNIMEEYKETLLPLPAAKYNHHAYRSGYLEHVLSVTKNCAFFADKYHGFYEGIEPPLDKGLCVAGGILHDIGKIRELNLGVSGAEYTPSGSLIGHILQGRDIVLEAARETEINADTLLRLEHIIVSHQRLPEWGSPKPPMTPEALIVHHSDDLDAKLQMMANIYQEDSTPGPMTARRNVLGHALYRGETEAEKE